MNDEKFAEHFAAEVSSDLGVSVEDARDLLRMMENSHFRQAVLDSWRIYESKGNDYTRGLGDLDRTDNFKKAAEFNKITALQAWGTFFYKQVSAVFRFVGDGKVESEPIEARIYDVINYAILLLLIVKEMRADSPGK